MFEHRELKIKEREQSKTFLIKFDKPEAISAKMRAKKKMLHERISIRCSLKVSKVWEHQNQSAGEEIVIICACGSKCVKSVTQSKWDSELKSRVKTTSKANEL